MKWLIRNALPGLALVGLFALFAAIGNRHSVEPLAAAPPPISPIDRVPADAALFAHLNAMNLWDHPAVAELRKTYAKEVEKPIVFQKPGVRVKTILDQRCVVCHKPGEEREDTLLTDYSLVAKHLEAKPPAHPMAVAHDCWRDLERRQIQRHTEAIKARIPTFTLEPTQIEWTPETATQTDLEGYCVQSAPCFCAISMECGACGC